MRISSWWARVALALSIPCVVGCASGGRGASFTPADAEQANVIVYLSNQSVARRSVVLTVTVDGRPALREEMDSVFHRAAAHDVPQAFPLRLAPGPHTIRVAVAGGVASRSTEVVVGADVLYVDASYEWAPGGAQGVRIPEKISLQVSAERPGFV